MGSVEKNELRGQLKGGAQRKTAIIFEGSLPENNQGHFKPPTTPQGGQTNSIDSEKMAKYNYIYVPIQKYQHLNGVLGMSGTIVFSVYGN